MASIQPRRNAAGEVVFRVMFRVDGKQKSVQFTDKDVAVDFHRTVERLGGAAALAITAAREERNAAAAPPLLKIWFEQHLELATGITDGTRADYRSTAARTWMPALGEVPLDALTRDDVRRWVRWQSTTPATGGSVLSAKSIANAHGLLSSVLSGAVEAGYALTNVARGVALPEGIVEDRVFLTHTEFARLLALVDPHWAPLVAFLAATGLRWGEATAMRWAEVDLDSPTPSVRVIRAWKRGEKGSRVIGPPKTRRSNRSVTLPSEVVALLRPLQRGPDDLVFVGRQGAVAAHQNFYLRAWTPAVRAFAGDTTAPDGTTVPGPGKRPRIHDLRHTHASWLIAAGIPLPVIQRRLGHESIQTTIDVYGHLDHTAGTLAADATSAALAAALGAREEPA